MKNNSAVKEQPGEHASPLCLPPPPLDESRQNRTDTCNIYPLIIAFNSQSMELRIIGTRMCREFFKDILPSSFCNPLARTFLVVAIFNRRNKFREYFFFFFFFAVAKWRPEIELDDISYFIYTTIGSTPRLLIW